MGAMAERAGSPAGRAHASEASALAVDELQRAVLEGPIAAFVAAAREPEAREGWGELAAAVEALKVPAHLMERFGAVVEAALLSGRVRRERGPGAELSLRALYLNTPRGRAAAAAVDALNAALAEFAGRPLSAASVTIRGPGAWALTLESAGAQIVIRFAPDGARAESVEIG